jgi:2,4-dienoyl-CoA reductase-like NADH-dependent reductase (Old Yellow Enzyme family)
LKIFEPIQVKNVIFQNRIVMAPMSPPELSQPLDGTMGDGLLQYYLERADNQMGMLILQSLIVAPPHGRDSYRHGIYSDNQKEQLTQVIEAYHKHGAKVFVQLIYPDVSYGKTQSVNQYTVFELEGIAADFIAAAKRCKEAGCDGVELHGAHGFFLNMMSSPYSNQRTDRYGGCLENRMELVREIAEGISDFKNDNFILSYRMGWTDSLEEDRETAQALERCGIEMLHVSSGIPQARVSSRPETWPYNEFVFAGTQVKKNVHVPVIVVNEIRTLERGNNLLDAGMCDFVAYGRPFLKDAKFLIHANNQKIL